MHAAARTTSDEETGDELAPATRAAVESLLHLLRDDRGEADRRLEAAVSSTPATEILDELVEVATRAISALRDRASYLVDTDVVLTWVGPVEGPMLGSCWTVLQRATFRSAGLHLPDVVPCGADEIRRQLAGAMLVACGLVELVARRRWVRAETMLLDLVGLELSEPADRTG